MTKIHSIADLKPDRKNANKGTQRGRSMVESSLRETGAGRSIVVDKDGRVIAGNKTLEAWADIADLDDVVIVPTDGKKLVIVQREDLDLSDDTGMARKLAIYDNRAGELGLEWDASELFASMQDGLDLGAFWNDDELGELFADLAPEESESADAEPQIDRAEELRQQWGVETGQLWRIGEHRLICGDCTDADVVARVMGGEMAAICFTSPPYSDQRTYTNNDNLSPEHLAKFILVSSSSVSLFVVNLGLKREGGEVVQYWDDYIKTARSCGLKILSWNVWSRHGFGGSIGNMTAMFPIEHEWIFVFGTSPMEIARTIPNKHGGKNASSTVRSRDGGTYRKSDVVVNDLGKLGSVFVSDVDRGRKAHPATFPVDLPFAYIHACSGRDDLIYEPFAGSGTTIVACENLSRRCRAIEISPAYCAVILERMSDAFPGIKIERI